MDAYKSALDQPIYRHLSVSISISRLTFLASVASISQVSNKFSLATRQYR